MDDRLTAVVEAQNHELEKQPPAVEAEKELLAGISSSGAPMKTQCWTALRTSFFGDTVLEG